MKQSEHNKFLPLAHVDLHVLLALRSKEKHGYAIMQEVDVTTNGQIKLGPGTLYGAIKRMLIAGLITESAHRPVSGHDDQRRRYYRLMPLGRRVLEAELERLASIVQMAVSAGFISQSAIT